MGHSNQARGRRRLRLAGRVLAGLLLTLSAGTRADAPSAAQPHRYSAWQHARSSPALLRQMQSWCENHLPPNDAKLRAALLHVEQKFHAERAAERKDLTPYLVERECLAQRLVELDPTFSTPVWYLSQLTLARIKSNAAQGPRLAARANNAQGPMRKQRISFSMGAHHSCFGHSDAKGLVTCTLVDTHPHGPGGGHQAEADNIVVSLQGSVSKRLIEWPVTAVFQRSR